MGNDNFVLKDGCSMRLVKTKKLKKGVKPFLKCYDTGELIASTGTQKRSDGTYWIFEIPKNSKTSNVPIFATSKGKVSGLIRPETITGRKVGKAVITEDDAKKDEKKKDEKKEENPENNDSNPDSSPVITE